MTALSANERFNELLARSSSAVSRDGLISLEEDVARDLERLGLPRKAWTVPRTAEDGAKLLDVLVIGAGQFGVGIASALKLAGVGSLEVLDKSEEGREGPWVTYARMPTLRSPKHLPGICHGIPSLTFQSWFRACHGDGLWAAMYKIPNAVWQDYILWVRKVLGIPVRNGAEVVDLQQPGDHVVATLAGGEKILAKRVVVANGRAGAGGCNGISCVSQELGPDRVAHTMHDIDFERLRGKRVAIIGVGASAFDNAATALEAGVASVDLLCRRPALPQLNKGRPISTIGFQEGWQHLDDADRWRLGAYIDLMEGVPPHETLLRCLATPGMRVHFRTRLVSASPSGEGVHLEVENGPSGDYDFLILATGFRIDLAGEPLFSAIHPRIRLWRDAYSPPDGLGRSHLGMQPYLGDDLALQAKDGPPLDRIHLFNSATFMSAGNFSGDVPSLSIAPQRLATALVRKLFAEDFDAIFTGLEAWEEEHELETTPFYAPEYVNTPTR